MTRGIVFLGTPSLHSCVNTLFQEFLQNGNKCLHGLKDKMIREFVGILKKMIKTLTRFMNEIWQQHLKNMS